MYSEYWMWPKPIYLCELEPNTMGLQQYDPSDPRDAAAQVCVLASQARACQVASVCACVWWWGGAAGLT
eukprot:363795-Chlamydomonas_euryale.AAC.3